MQADIISTCPLANDESLLISCRNLKRVMKRRTEGEIINAEMSAKKRKKDTDDQISLWFNYFAKSKVSRCLSVP